MPRSKAAKTRSRPSTGNSAGVCSGGSGGGGGGSSSEMAQTSQASQIVPAPDLDQLVVRLVKLVLNLSVNKHPIKRTDLVKHALAGNGRVFREILPQAMAELEDVFGYKLIEVKRNTTFILVSTIASGSELEWTEDFKRKYTLLYLVLAHIFMNQGSVPEQKLYDFLEKLRIPMDGKTEHKFFGNALHLIRKTFVKQLYLDRSEPIVVEEGTKHDGGFFFSWGVRADHEVSKKDLLESVSKLMGKSSWSFLKQHRAANGLKYKYEEEEEERDRVNEQPSRGAHAGQPMAACGIKVERPEQDEAEDEPQEQPSVMPSVKVEDDQSDANTP